MWKNAILVTFPQAPLHMELCIEIGVIKSINSKRLH